MFRKRIKEEFSQKWDQQSGQIRHTVNSLNTRKEQVEVTLLMGAQRSPLTIDVPQNCNMKILKSILWFHLKKILTITQYNTILGFQCSPSNYQLDYQLQKGLGQLKGPLNLTPFLKNSRHRKDSLLNYKICKLLSEGGFSKVYLMRNHQDGQFVAGKFILKQSTNSELVHNEYQLASDMSNSFIVRTLAFIETQTFYVIVMQYVPGGELFELLKLYPKMNEEQARFYIVQTLLSLKYLHNQNIIYRDIKPENIMLDEQGHIKLTDFGLAKKGHQRVFSFCGSLDYMAPEVITDYGYSFEADYYSVGNLLYELLCGIPPFYQPHANQQETKYKILKLQVPIPVNIPLSETVVDLLKKLLEKDASKRLGHFEGVDEILEHSWFSEVDIDNFITKIIDPPFKGIININNGVDSSQNEEQKQWQKMIEKDIKQQHIKAIYHRKNTYVRRFKSVDEEGTNYKGSLPSSPARERGKQLKSNMSLLFVLTHKRSTSQFSKKDNKFQPGSYLTMLKSANVSRKVSQCSPNKQSRVKMLETKDKSFTHLRNNFMLMRGDRKSKENCGMVRKKKKELGSKIFFKGS